MKDTNMIVQGDIEVIEAEVVGSSIDSPSGDLTGSDSNIAIEKAWLVGAECSPETIFWGTDGGCHDKTFERLISGFGDSLFSACFRE
jgi:hypothetical protein